jgi:hypothetical protein
LEKPPTFSHSGCFTFASVNLQRFFLFMFSPECAVFYTLSNNYSYWSEAKSCGLNLHFPDG